MDELSRFDKVRRVRPTNSFIEFKKEEIEQSFPDRFEQQVRKYPDKLAVKSGNNQLTYDELNRAANRVAQTILAQRGDGEEPIALLFEHGIPLIIGILGISKAGKIYMPMDSAYHRTRLTYMLEHSQTGLIVTNTVCSSKWDVSEIPQPPFVWTWDMGNTCSGT